MGQALKKRIQQSKFESPIIEAYFNILVTADYLKENVEQVCSKYLLTAGQYNVLRILRGAGPGGRSRSEIAERLLEKAPDVTRLVDRLEARGLAERARSDEDRRLSITRITARGLRLVEKMGPDIKGVETALAERLTRRDARELSRICEGIYGEE